MKRATTLIFAILLFIGKIEAQSAADSLKKIISAEKNVTRKVDLLLQLCEVYRYSDRDSCLAYGNKTIKLLQQIKDTDNIPKAELYVISYYYLSGKSDSALLMIKKNIPLLQSKPDLQSTLAKYYSTGGLCYMKLDQKKEALEFFYTALRIAEKSHDNDTQIKAKLKYKSNKYIKYFK